ncbi:lytic murein transglycosylase [Undibacter mobilis]|uniref:Lytic murein transglycosylase n=2 Tax=Undibacter mobilis TaxID=2292256 RepID=A0A371BDU1_9BRAD|nr:lytic murein transglycosylase [Undibacter mobilis]
MRRTALALVAGFALAGLGATGTAQAAPRCVNTHDFSKWLAQFKKDALAHGITQQTLNAASPELTYDESVIKRDSGQGVFQLTFIQFSNRLLGGKRIPNGLAKIQEHRALFSRIEKTYGVPPEVITAVWGLESDYGALFGKFKILPALTTLAYDCRRGDKFREELIDALKIIQRGDKTVDQMTGNWAGEFGGMQFTPSNYIKYGVDFDGDGHRDLVNSTADTLASAANYLHAIGWRRGEPWLQEVSLPDEMPWQEADLDTQHPRSQWIAWGVRAAHGAALPRDNAPASLILPMGRKGPAFLAYQNFHVFTDWNSSFVYATTVAYFATRLGGAPPVNEAGAKDIRPITTEQMMELQRQLQKRGFDVGEVDGRLGAGTRKAVRTMQVQYGMPADSWPTDELIARLQSEKNPVAVAPLARQPGTETKAATPRSAAPTPVSTAPVAPPPVQPEAETPRTKPSRAATTAPQPTAVAPPLRDKITVRVWTVQGCLTLRMSPEKAREYRRC